MSIYSDHKVGALTDEEYESLCALENRRERYYIEREEYLRANDYDEERADDYDGYKD